MQVGVITTNQRSARYFQSVLTTQVNLTVLLISNNSFETQLSHLRTAIKQLKYPLDGIFGVSDKTSALASVLVKELQLSGPHPSAVAALQHKFLASQLIRAADTSYQMPQYISSRELRNHIPQLRALTYPVFYKPCKANLSRNIGKAQTPKLLEQKLKDYFESVPQADQWYSSFFDLALQIYPSTHSFLIESVQQGRQFTLDGVCFKQRIQVVGLTESIFDQQGHSFVRFDACSVSEQMLSSVLKKLEVIFHLSHFDNSAFNVEFFITQSGVYIIEINTRLSMQFMPLLNHNLHHSYAHTLGDLACGRQPRIRRFDKLRLVSCCILRTNEDQYVQTQPDQEALQEFLADKPEILEVAVYSKQNYLLSEIPQDPYSFRYASMTICGPSLQHITQLYERYRTKLDRLFYFT